MNESLWLFNMRLICQCQFTEVDFQYREWLTGSMLIFSMKKTSGISIISVKVHLHYYRSVKSANKKSAVSVTHGFTWAWSSQLSAGMSRTCSLTPLITITKVPLKRGTLCLEIKNRNLTNLFKKNFRVIAKRKTSLRKLFLW